MFGQVGGESVLSRLNIPQPLNNSGRLFCCIVIRSVGWNGRNFDCSPACIINLHIRCVWWNFELYINIISYSNNNDPVSCLWNSIVFKLVQIGIEFISGFTHFIKNFGECLAIICIAEPTYIFCEKPLRLIEFQHFNSVWVEGTINTIHAFLFTNDTVIIAWKSECKGINRGELGQIKFSDISMINAGWGIGTNIPSICFTSVFIIVVCPSMDDFILWATYIGMCCTPCEPSGSAEEFP